MASILVNINKAPTCAVRILNTFSSPIELMQVQKSEKNIYKAVAILAEAEHVSENENLNCTR